MQHVPASSPAGSPSATHQGPLPGGACSSSWLRSAPSAAPSACRTPSGVSSWPPSAPNTAASSPFKSRNVCAVLAGCCTKLRQRGGSGAAVGDGCNAAGRVLRNVPRAAAPTPNLMPAPPWHPRHHHWLVRRSPAGPRGCAVCQHAIEHGHQRRPHRVLHTSRCRQGCWVDGRRGVMAGRSGLQPCHGSTARQCAAARVSPPEPLHSILPPQPPARPPAAGPPPSLQHKRGWAGDAGWRLQQPGRGRGQGALSRLGTG